MRSVAAACGVLVVFFAVPGARADDDAVAAAWVRYRQADFEGVLSGLAAAEEQGLLAPEDYPRALEIRALAAHAIGRHELVRSTLRVLAAVSPEYGLGPEAVPILREHLDGYRRADERARLLVSTRVDGEDVEVRARVTRDPLELVRRVTVFARRAGDARYLTGDGQVRVLDAEGGEVEYWVEALGPARVPLAARGSPEDPLRLSVGDEGTGLGVGWALAIGGVAVALVTVAIVIAVVLLPGGGDGATVRPMPPWEP